MKLQELFLFLGTLCVFHLETRFILSPKEQYKRNLCVLLQSPYSEKLL